MNNKTAIDFRNPTVIRNMGMLALKKELGTVGATYFIRQFTVGKGDYTTEREELLKGITLNEIIENVRKIDEQKHR